MYGGGYATNAWHGHNAPLACHWRRGTSLSFSGSNIAIYIGAGRVGKVFRAGCIQHATSACIAVDRRTGRVLVLSSRHTHPSEPWLLAWGGWSNG